MLSGVVECCKSMCKPALFRCLIAIGLLLQRVGSLARNTHQLASHRQQAAFSTRQTDDLSLCGAAIMDQTAVQCLRCEV